MNGNVTKEGIAADLEAMQRVGIGGVEIFNASEGIPAGPVKFNSPEWHDMFSFAVKEANRLGLQLCVHNCAGWSSSGGPWDSPEHSMEHVVITETKVAGGQKFSGTLPQPRTEWNVYHDIAVLAFRTPDGEGVSMKSADPKISASIPNIDGGALLDGSLFTMVTLPTNQMPQHVQLEFPQPFASRNAVLTFGQGAGTVTGVIQISDNGKTFRDLREFTTPSKPTRPLTFAFGKQVSAKFYRIQFTATGSRTKSLDLAGIDLSPRLRIENVDAKDGDSGAFVASSDVPNDAPENLLLKHREVLDLTSHMDANGHLDWDAPAGNWTVLRVGRTPTGRNNHPAPDEGTGPECDKFSAAALDAHWAGFVQKCIDDAGPLAGKGKTFNGVLIDSYEVGGQNWSENFRAEFRKRRGYDPLKFLPTFTGRVVDSPEISERFLFDVRRTISDLFADDYYGHFKELCDAHGMTASIEPYTGPYESLQQGKAAEIPMGEFWVGGNNIDSSVKLASSVGHIYGRNVIGAESFTARPSAQHGRWLDDPYALKALGDRVFCSGINRYIFHRFAMQPWTNRWPGMTMGQWGTHFDRTCTWWEQGRAWLKYVTRCQFLLQQGRFVADAAYFCGENSPAEMRIGDPPLPPGYDFDAVGADVLKDATVENHELVLKSGMRYRVLILPPSDRNISPPLLKKIRSLVAAGLTLVGPPPEHAPGLENYPRCDQEVKSLANDIWGDCDSKKVTTHGFGKGRVYWGATMETVFAALDIKPDFEFSPSLKSDLCYIHRTDGDTEIYFVSNQRDQYDSADCTFRVSGKTPELWHADTGVMEPAPVWREENGRTIVPLRFDPSGSVFVVFRHPAAGDHVVAVSKNVQPQKSVHVPELVIHSAVYGVDLTSKTGKTFDLTAKLSRLVENGALSVKIDNDFAGGDPLYGQPKECVVDYSLDGVRKSVTVAENETLVIGKPGTSGEPPAVQLHAEADGQMIVSSTAPGTVELTFASGKKRRAEISDVPAVTTVSGPWNLTFPPNWGAPVNVTFDKLMSWTDSPDKGVRYFSGTATYTKDIDVPAKDLQAGHSLWLDLGGVKNLAQVFVNGESLGILWKPPFRVNLTGVAQPGKNTLEIKITNLWPNRLIGDEQLPDDREWVGKRLKAWPQWVLDGKPSPTGRFTFTTWHHWTKDDALLESGLLGPVQLIVGVRAPLSE